MSGLLHVYTYMHNMTAQQDLLQTQIKLHVTYLYKHYTVMYWRAFKPSLLEKNFVCINVSLTASIFIQDIVIVLLQCLYNIRLAFFILFSSYIAYFANDKKGCTIY